MNTERLEHIAKLLDNAGEPIVQHIKVCIEEGPGKIWPVNGPGTFFQMANYYKDTDCGTVCCIAGLAIHQFDDIPTGWYYEQGRRLLDLTDEQAVALFTPPGVSCADNWDEYTPQRAARVIRHLIATGTVDWNIA